MARFKNPQRTAAERLRLIVSRDPGGYNVGRRKAARTLGVTERSVERYLQRRGDSKRNIRSREAQTKINRMFTSRVRKDPLFLATYVLDPGEFFDITPWMAPTVGDGATPILVPWRAGAENRLPNSVWLRNRPLPRIIFTGGARMGLGFGRIAVNLRTEEGELVGDGELRDYSTPNEFASDTFGYVDDKTLEIKGRSNDLSVGINRTLEDLWERSNREKSDNIVLAVFDPKAGVDIYQSSIMETLGSTVRNRRPIVNRDDEGNYTGVEWNQRSRRRKR